MIRCVFNVSTSLIIVACFLSQSAFSGIFSAPRMINHGSYKNTGLSGHNNLRPLVGHVPREVSFAKKIGPMEEDRILPLSIMLPWENEEALDQLISDLTNPQSEKFRQYLKQEEFYRQFAPSKTKVNKVVSYLQYHGFTVDKVAPNHVIIKASASVKAINEVFSTEINYYIDTHGEKFFAPAYELQVDKSLEIIGALGLENRTKLKRLGKKTPVVSDPLPEELVSCVGTGGGLTPAAIAKAYSLTTFSTNALANAGAGQTVALFELCTFVNSDITGYATTYGLTPFNISQVQTIMVDGGASPSCVGADEVTLDIEMIMALAPKANIRVYEGPNTPSGVVDTFNQIAIDNNASAVSTSWGLTEGLVLISQILGEYNAFKQMTAQGQTVFAASGDSGSYADNVTLSVNDPASQPLVIGVGGTQLTYNISTCAYTSETSWTNGSNTAECLVGGGGGVSSLWSIPSWQIGIGGDNGASTTVRNVPDISLEAGAVGYSVYYSGSLVAFGGTSASAPLWAAYTLLVNEARANNNLGVLGFFGPVLYQIGQAADYATLFHDITTGTNGLGSNIITCSASTAHKKDQPSNIVIKSGEYPAGTGYDLSTGWGSFKGDSLIAFLSTIDTPPPPCVQGSSDRPCLKETAKN